MTFTFLHNSLEHWGMALGVAVAATATMYFVRALVLHHLRTMEPHGPTGLHGLVASMLAKTWLLFIFAIGLYLGSLFLVLPPQRVMLMERIAITALLLQLAVWGDTGLCAWRDQYRRNQLGVDPDGSRRASSTVLGFIFRLALWVVIVLMVLDNFGFSITTLVASLGIGGVAVALAVQNILGDLFASLSIMLDKPFEIGDFIIVGDVLGSVEHIGLKTTRVRSLGGEQVVFSNGDLLKSRIHNHKRMETRRVAFILRIAYGTSEQQLSSIPELVRRIVTAQPNVDFERTHFMHYGEWSLDFEVVYHFKSPDYLQHMDAQQAVFLELYRAFEREGILFAHPLSVVRLADQESMARLRMFGPPPSGDTRH
jgi:small-conductance mechanosensitive channel